MGVRIAPRAILRRAGKVAGQPRKSFLGIAQRCEFVVQKFGNYLGIRLDAHFFPAIISRGILATFWHAACSMLSGMEVTADTETSGRPRWRRTGRQPRHVAEALNFILLRALASKEPGAPLGDTSRIDSPHLLAANVIAIRCALSLLIRLADTEPSRRQLMHRQITAMAESLRGEKFPTAEPQSIPIGETAAARPIRIARSFRLHEVAP